MANERIQRDFQSILPLTEGELESIRELVRAVMHGREEEVERILAEREAARRIKERMALQRSSEPSVSGVWRMALQAGKQKQVTGRPANTVAHTKPARSKKWLAGAH